MKWQNFLIIQPASQPASQPANANELNLPVNENLIIQGDNLEALKSLLPFYAGQVKCIFVDPPYNTRASWKHYDDNLEHSLWLSLMYPRFELLRELLSEDGSIWITLDDNESHYFKVMIDEIFGRNNFISNLIWEKKRKPSYLGKLGKITDNIFCYAKDKSKLKDLTFGNKSDSETYPLYNAGNTRAKLIFPPKTLNFLKHKDGIYQPQNFSKKTSTVTLVSELIIENQWNINEVTIEGEWRYSQKTLDEQLNHGEYYVVKSLDFRPRRVFEREVEKKKIHNLISRSHYGMATNEDSAEEHLTLFNEAVAEDSFDYPKPEKLIQFVLDAASDENDLVLDSFLGSGTTAAVAHKMKRRYIGIEIGEHAKTHVVPRLQKVIMGEQGGISVSQEFYELENDELENLDLEVEDLKKFNKVLKIIGNTDLLDKATLKKVQTATKLKKVKGESIWQGGGSFRFCELGETIFDEFGSINPAIKFDDLAAHIWYAENYFPLPALQKNIEKSPLVGVHNGKVFYLLFNGILGDKRPQGGNVLTSVMLKELPQLNEFVQAGLEIIVYGESCRLASKKLAEHNITFKLIPHDVSAK